MIASLEHFLRGNSVAMLFLVLGLGYLFGKVRIRGFEPGAISGVLFVGLIFVLQRISLLPKAPGLVLQRQTFTRTSLFSAPSGCRRVMQM